MTAQPRPTPRSFPTSSTTPTSTPRRRRARTRSTSTPTRRTWRSAWRPAAANDRRQLLYNGRPARFTFKNFQVVGSNEQLAEVGVKDLGASDDEGGQVIPGSLLTRLNPLKDSTPKGARTSPRSTAPCRNSSTTRPTGSR